MRRVVGDLLRAQSSAAAHDLTLSYRYDSLVFRRAGLLHERARGIRMTVGEPGVGASLAAMTRTVRPSTPADAAAIVALLVESGLLPNLAPEHLHWKYWQERTDWPGPRSFVLERGGEILAHAGIVPGTCAWGQRQVPFVHVIDWAARHSAIGAGTALMRSVGRQTGVLFAVGGSADTLRILPHIGFRPAGMVEGYARTLFPLRRLRGARGPRWKLLPHFARSMLWTLRAPSSAGGEWQARPLADHEVNQIATVLPEPVHGLALMTRSVALLRYMLACPIVRMSLFAVQQGTRTRGYFLLASAPGQVRIADCWVNSDSSADWREMILCAVQQAKLDSQAAEVVIWASDRWLARTLEESGFHRRNKSPIRIWPVGEGSPPGESLRIQMLDNDAAYIHEGRNEYWA